jgi:hypothetical protein
MSYVDALAAADAGRHRIGWDVDWPDAAEYAELSSVGVLS